MKIYLARHGETDWNVQRLMQGTTDTDLNENGLAQAARLGEKMVGSGIVHVYTSRLKRANHTGQIVAEHLGVPCEARDGMQEVGLGEWEGRTWTDIVREMPELTERWAKDRRNARPPKGEIYQEVLDRMVSAVVRIVREAKGDVMIVSHNGTIRYFLAALYQTPLETMTTDYVTPNAACFEVDGAKILERFG